MAARRARSAERLRDGGNDMDRIADLLERMLARQAPPAPIAPVVVAPPPAREVFKAPEYSGKGDVELYIRQFSDVAEANQWTAGATLLHLRSKLKEGAQDCGQGHTVETIFTALRARYGMSVREARAKLNDLRKHPKVSLHEHALEVEKLVSLAYADLPIRHQEEMCMDKFSNTLGNAYLQRHLLAIPTPDLETAVRAGNEYLQIRNSPGSVGLREIIAEEEELLEQEVAPVQSNPVVEPLQLLTKMVSDLTKELASLKKQVSQSPSRQGPPTNPAAPLQWTRAPNTCWTCNGEGHWRRDCPQRPLGTRPQANQRSGNGYSPQQ